MTKKDYVKIAAVIKKSLEHYRPYYQHAGVEIPEALSNLAQDLAVVFASDNDKFDQDRFLEACGL